MSVSPTLARCNEGLKGFRSLCATRAVFAEEDICIIQQLDLAPAPLLQCCCVFVIGFTVCEILVGLSIVCICIVTLPAVRSVAHHVVEAICGMPITSG